ncbi:type I restriction-modification enzyme R subunit C-terminal domain-containing protein [Pirellulaceae bacterium SH449]
MRAKRRSFERLREQVVKIASLLEEKHTIPMVGKQMTYIQDVQREEWWQDVNIPMLEIIRRRLRDLVQFIERREHKPIYTNFEDEMGEESNIEQAKQENESFGIFVRTLVGLDREVAKGLFNEFLSGTTYNANQIEFINLIINQLVDHGIVDIGLLYESPFTDISPTGPDALFTVEQVNRIMQLLEEIRLTALAA